MRYISDIFIENLLTGELADLLQYILKDHTLDIEIRENYLNIYYRGGNILNVSEVSGNSYFFTFDKNYLDGTPDFLNKLLVRRDWVNYFPTMKQSMDFYFSKRSKEEREFQQLIVRENNYSSIANSTDYFIIDVEYDNHLGARYDLVAVEWPSKGHIRKLSKGYMPKLIVIEMKYGDRALTGKAGIDKHHNDYQLFLSDPDRIFHFKQEMNHMLHQKRKLGLIPSLNYDTNPNEIIGFEDKIELAYLFANHDPESSKLNDIIQSYKSTEVKFIVSNFMGYGIYNNSIYSYDEFLSRYNDQFNED